MLHISSINLILEQYECIAYSKIVPFNSNNIFKIKSNLSLYKFALNYLESSHLMLPLSSFPWANEIMVNKLLSMPGNSFLSDLSQIQSRQQLPGPWPLKKKRLKLTQVKLYPLINTPITLCISTAPITLVITIFTA